MLSLERITHKKWTYRKRVAMVMTSGNIVLVPYGSQEEDAVFVVAGGEITLFSGL